MTRGEPARPIFHGRQPVPIADRFWLNVDQSGGLFACWLWLAATNRAGYGVTGECAAGACRQYKAHRVAFELTRGSIPAGLTLDHLCRNPRCVNPAHLEPVTSAENTRRGKSYLLSPETCPVGHPYTAENSYVGRVRVKGGRVSRRCRICTRARGLTRKAEAAAYYQTHKAERLAYRSGRWARGMR